MHFAHCLRAVCGLEHMKASSVVGEIDEPAFHGNVPQIALLKKSKKAGAGGILPSENNRGWTDVDSNHIKTALNQKYGIMAWARPDVQGLADRDCTGIDQSDQVRVGPPRIPRQSGRIALCIEVFPMLGIE